MKKTRKYQKSPKCPDVVNGFLEICGAAALGIYVKQKVRKDFENGHGSDSVKAAAAVFGSGSLRKGRQGRINLGGLIRLNSALKEMEKNNATASRHPHFQDADSRKKVATIDQPHEAGIWRKHCEDGSGYGLFPEDFNSADDYQDALEAAKHRSIEESNHLQNFTGAFSQTASARENRYRWRLHCEDGSLYGVSPDEYEAADDYHEALTQAKKSGERR